MTKFRVLMVMLMCSAPAWAAPTTPGDPLPRLRDAAERAGVLVGVAVSSQVMRNPEAHPRYLELLGQQFNILTAENAMKFGPLSRGPGTYDWSLADRIFDFAEKHDMKVRFHAGLWHTQAPAWIEDTGLTDEQIAQHAKAHIEAIAERYGKRMHCWDVVNEPFDPKAPDGLRDTVWKRAIGPDYLVQVHRWAHAAAPDVKIVINDYGIIGGGTKADVMFGHLKAMRDAGVPVHAAGFQTHWLGSRAPSEARIVTNLQRFADLGLEIHITEMDVSTGPLKGTIDEKLQQQAALYARVINACKKVDGFTVFQTWGFTDRFTWVKEFKNRPDDQPLLFTADYEPKPAFWAVLEALRSNQ